MFGIGVLVVGFFLWRLRSELPGIARAGALLLGVLVTQMAVGEIQYRNALPWWLVVDPRLARGDDLGADGRDRLRPLPASRAPRRGWAPLSAPKTPGAGGR